MMVALALVNWGQSVRAAGVGARSRGTVAISLTIPPRVELRAAAVSGGGGEAGTAVCLPPQSFGRARLQLALTADQPSSAAKSAGSFLEVLPAPNGCVSAARLRELLQEAVGIGHRSALSEPEREASPLVLVIVPD